MTTTATVSKLNDKELDFLINRVTAFGTMETLKKAVSIGYRPTLRGVPASRSKADVAFAKAESLLADELEIRGISVYRGIGR